jgi:orotate phosphoribosyltransferase
MEKIERLKRFIQDKCLKFGEFQLAHAGVSDFYIDGKQLTFDADGAYLLSEIIYDLIKDRDVNAIGGIVLGSIPIAVGVSIFSLSKGKKISPFAVRKEVKSHGTQSHIEGSIKPGDKVIIVEDVVSTGGSVIESIKKVQELGCEIVSVIAIVDRQKGGKEAIESTGCRYEPLLTIEDLELERMRRERR